MNPPPATAVTPKGASTRGMLLDRAADMASRVGLEGVTIGELAAMAGMSKSGVFAHFGSREDLQLTVLEWTAERYARAVIMPAVGLPRGLPRLRAIMENWFRWVCDNPDGCLILAAAHEYDARPGLLHDRIVDWLRQLRVQLMKAIGMCVETGELARETDPVLLAFELFAIAQGLHDARLYDAAQAPLLARRSLDRLLASYGAPAVSTPA